MTKKQATALRYILDGMIALRKEYWGSPLGYKIEPLTHFKDDYRAEITTPIGPDTVLLAHIIDTTSTLRYTIEDNRNIIIF